MRYKFIILTLTAALSLNACGAPQTGATSSSGEPADECNGGGGIYVVDTAWTKPARAGQPVSAAYITLCNNGREDDAIVSLSHDGVKAVEIHQSAMDDGVMKMKKLDKFSVPAGKKTVMAPGGVHLMLIGITDPIETGQPIKIRFEFEKAAPAQFAFEVLNSEPADSRSGL